MYLCYVDESGGVEPPNAPSQGVTPASVIVGVVCSAVSIPVLTQDFLALKRAHFPTRFSHRPALDHVLTEIKGSEVLKLTRSSDRNKRRHAARIRSSLLDLLETHSIRIIGRVWIKEPTTGLDPVSTYTFSLWHIKYFVHAIFVKKR